MGEVVLFDGVRIERAPRELRVDMADAMARALAFEPVDLGDELAVIDFLMAAGWAWHREIHGHLAAAIRGAKRLRAERDFT